MITVRPPEPGSWLFWLLFVAAMVLMSAAVIAVTVTNDLPPCTNSVQKACEVQR